MQKSSPWVKIVKMSDMAAPIRMKFTHWEKDLKETGTKLPVGERG